MANALNCMENGGVGATTNPVIVKNVLEKEYSEYKGDIEALIKKFPTASEDEIAWLVIEKMALDGAKQFAGGYDDLVKIIRKLLFVF